MKEVLKLKMLRNKHQLTVSQLSYKSNVARSYITELEAGKYDNPSLDVICKFCKALKVTPNDLIDKKLWQ